jgi:hypothetical protein
LTANFDLTEVEIASSAAFREAAVRASWLAVEPLDVDPPPEPAAPRSMPTAQPATRSVAASIAPTHAVRVALCLRSRPVGPLVTRMSVFILSPAWRSVAGWRR